MRRLLFFSAIMGWSFVGTADVLVSHPTSTTYVTTFSAGQGYSAGAVPWSLVSPRSPASGFTGTPYYGGATGSLAVAVNAIHMVNHSFGDYMNLSASGGIIGDWIVMVPMYPLASASEITNVVVQPRLSGSANNQTNFTRFVIQQDGLHYLSSTNWYFNSNAQTFDQTAIDALSWYTYDPTNNLSGSDATPAAGVGPTNVTAVGVMFYNESKIVGTLAVGMAAFHVWGDPVAAPVSSTNRLMYWDATNNVSGLQNGGGVWDISGTNWIQNGIGQNLSWSNGTKDRAIFQGSESGMWTVSVAAATAITNIGITFSTTNAVYEIAGPGSLAMADTPVITTVVRGVISAEVSSEAFTKRGGDTLVLAGSNTVSGVLSNEAGILQVGLGASGDLGHATVENLATLLFAHDGALALTNRIYGTGEMLLTNTALVAWSGHSITQANVNIQGGATLLQSAGTINVPGQVIIAGGVDTAAIYSIQGGVTYVPTTIVGRASVGELHVESGGSLVLSGVGTPLLLSDLDGGTGRVFITGGGSSITAPEGTARIGNGYPAELTISDGGLLVASNMTVYGSLEIGSATGVLDGALTLARLVGEQAVFNIDGASSSFSVTNSNPVISGLYVGNLGEAVMTISNGTLRSGSLDIPVNAGTGTLTMVDGAYDIDASVQVGYIGVGRMVLAGGYMENDGAAIIGQASSGYGTAIVQNATWIQRARFELWPGSAFEQTGGAVTNTSPQKRDYWGNTSISGGNHVLNGGGIVSVRDTFTLSGSGRFINASTNPGANAHTLVGGSSAGGTEGTLVLAGGTFIMTNAAGLKDDLLLAAYSSNTGLVQITGGSAHVRALALGGIPTNYNSFSLFMHRATGSHARLELSAGELYIENGISNLIQSGSSELWLSGGTLGALGDWHSAASVDITLTNSPGPGTPVIDTAGHAITLNGSIAGPASITLGSGGVLTLAGTNTYAGDTVVSAGTLALAGSGSISNSPTISVAAGATLSVTGRTDGTLHLGGAQSLSAGTVEGNVSLEGGAVIPGSSPGSLYVDRLILNSGSYRFEITNATGTAGTDWDVINVYGGAGTTDLSGASSGSVTVRLESILTSLPNFPVSGIVNWKLIDGGLVSAFDSNAFTIVTDDFYPIEHYGVTFAISESGGDIFLTSAPITNETDLGVTVTASPTYLQYGDTNAVTIVVTNNSALSSGAYYVTNVLSTGVVYEVAAVTTNPSTLDVTYHAANGGVFNGGFYITGSAFPGGAYIGGYISWNLGGLGANSSTTLMVSAQQFSASESTQTVNNAVSVTVTTAQNDPNASNNSDATSFESVGIPALSTVATVILIAVIVFIAYQRLQGNRLVTEG